MNPLIKQATQFLENPQDNWQAILIKIKTIADLSKKIAAYFDDQMNKHCQVANLNGTKLVMLVANGATATQLRFMMPDLLRKFKSDPNLPTIDAIEFKVRPPLQGSRAMPTKSTVSKLSPEAAEIMREIKIKLQQEQDEYKK